MDLDEYIKKEVEKGFSKTAIKNALLKAGYKKEILDKKLGEFDKTHHFYAHNKWLNIVFVVIGIIIVTMLLLLFYGVGEEKPGEIAKKPAKIKIKHQEKEDVIALMEKARDGDMSACEKISNDIHYHWCLEKHWETKPCWFEKEKGVGLDDCYYEEAEKTNDMDFCFRIEDKDRENECKNKIIQISIEKKDVSMCKDDYCLINMSIALKKPELLEQIKREEVREEAYIDYSKETGESLCHKITDPDTQIACEYSMKQKSI